MTERGHVLVGFEALAVLATSYMGVPLRLVSITRTRAPTLPIKLADGTQNVHIGLGCKCRGVEGTY